MDETRYFDYVLKSELKSKKIVHCKDFIPIKNISIIDEADINFKDNYNLNITYPGTYYIESKLYINCNTNDHISIGIFNNNKLLQNSLITETVKYAIKNYYINCSALIVNSFGEITNIKIINLSSVPLELAKYSITIKKLI
ncbi:MAG: hypothetical protein RSB67_03695 [Clostridia bacterium]